MKIGFDTSFFYGIIQGNKKIIEIWNTYIKGGREGFISCLTLFELERISLKGKLGKQKTEIMLKEIPKCCEVIWLDNAEILSFSAKLSKDNNIPSIDSLILTSFILFSVKTVYTKDADFELYTKKDCKIFRIT